MDDRAEELSTRTLRLIHQILEPVPDRKGKSAPMV
jgi:hypothetical protein